MALELPKIDLEQAIRKVPLLQKIPFLRPPPTVGVDIGSHSVKVVWMEAAGEGWKIQAVAGKMIAPNATSPDIPAQERRGLEKQALQEILDRFGIKGADATVSVSGTGVVVRYVRFEKMPPEDLAKALPTEVSNYLPFDVADVHLGHQILGEVQEEGRPKLETVVAAAKREVVEQRLQVLREAGLRPVVVDVDAFCCQNAMEIRGLVAEKAEGGTEGLLFLVHIGMTKSTFAVLDGGVIRFVRETAPAGNDFSRALQRQMQADFRKAEELKAQHGLSDAATEEGKRVAAALAAPTKDLLTNIQRSLDFYHSQAGEKPLAKVYLSGGGANLPGLDRHLEEALHVPVLVLNPLEGLAPPTLAQEAGLPASAFSVAVGLACRRLHD